MSAVKVRRAGQASSATIEHPSPARNQEPRPAAPLQTPEAPGPKGGPDPQRQAHQQQALHLTVANLEKGLTALASRPPTTDRAQHAKRTSQLKQLTEQLARIDPAQVDPAVAARISAALQNLQARADRSHLGALSKVQVWMNPPAAAAPEDATEAPAKTLLASATHTLTVAQMATLQKIARAGLLDPGTLGVVLGLGISADLAGVVMGLAGWAGSAVAATLAAVKSSVPTAMAFELAAAKVVDYQLATRLRAPGSRAEPFFVAMSRAGLDVGWAADARGLPWWYAPLSYGASGGMDFFLGQVLGRQLRAGFESVAAQVPDLDPARKAALAEAFRARMLEALSQALEPPPGTTLQSPLTRHLAEAIRGKHDPRWTERIEESLVTRRPGNPTLGTVAGHGAAGALVGVITGDPLLGMTVGFVDAVGDAVLTEAALAGRMSTLGKLKAQLLRDGWSGGGGGLAQTATDYYAQIGMEFRQLGHDLHVLADSGRVRLNALSDPAAEAERWLAQELGLPAIEQTDLKQLFERLGELIMQTADGALEHHAGVPLNQALRDDFPEVVAAAKSAAAVLRAQVLAAATNAAQPDLRRLSPQPLQAEERRELLEPRQGIDQTTSGG